MTKTRLASIAAACLFGLAAIGGAVVAFAAPANASAGALSNQHTAGSTPQP
jgi:hypothetical protein